MPSSRSAQRAGLRATHGPRRSLLLREGRSCPCLSCGRYPVFQHRLSTKAFRRSDTIGGHQHGKMQKGDTLYIYYAAPYSCLLYRCEITETDIPVHYGKYRLGIRIRRTHTFRRGALSLEILKEHGLSAVRSARSMPVQTEEFIAEAIKEGSCLL